MEKRRKEMQETYVSRGKSVGGGREGRKMKRREVVRVDEIERKKGEDEKAGKKMLRGES